MIEGERTGVEQVAVAGQGIDVGKRLRRRRTTTPKSASGKGPRRPRFTGSKCAAEQATAARATKQSALLSI
jgi:hypothetical protein